MPNLYIFVRGVIANNLSLFMVLFWLLTLVVLFFSCRAIYKWRQGGKPLAGKYRTFFLLILIINLVTYIPFLVSGIAAFLLLVTAFGHYFHDLMMFIYYLLLIAFILLGSICLVIFAAPKRVTKILPRKKGGLAIAIMFGLVLIDFALKVFFLGGFVFLIYGKTLWPGVRLTTELNAQLRLSGDLPRDEKQLRQIFPTEVKKIKAYGKFCYFYFETDDNYLLVTKFAGHWSIYNRQHEYSIINANDPQWLPWIKKCQ